MGLLPLTYTRPKHVDQQSFRSSVASSGRDSLSDGEKTDGSVKSGSSGYSSSIPDSLTFDKIINGGTCPVSLHTLVVLPLRHSLTDSPYSP
jgi:hypothetical protein